MAPTENQWPPYGTINNAAMVVAKVELGLSSKLKLLDGSFIIKCMVHHMISHHSEVGE